MCQREKWRVSEIWWRVSMIWWLMSELYDDQCSNSICYEFIYISLLSCSSVFSLASFQIPNIHFCVDVLSTENHFNNLKIYIK